MMMMKNVYLYSYFVICTICCGNKCTKKFIYDVLTSTSACVSSGRNLFLLCTHLNNGKISTGVIRKNLRKLNLCDEKSMNK